MNHHLLVPVDGSDLSEGALLYATDLARKLAARVTILYALPSADAYAYATVPPFVDRADIDGRTLQEVHQLIAERAQSYLAGLFEQVHQTTVPVALECVERDEPHRAILEGAERLGCDLIMMASHGRRGLSTLLLGSETQKVLTHANMPVLVWRPPVAAG